MPGQQGFPGQPGGFPGQFQPSLVPGGQANQAQCHQT
jgi:hypothetical protein